MFPATDDEIIEKFKKLKTRQDVADLLEIKEKSLRYFLFVKKTENLYTSFEIPKKNGGVRNISAPQKELKLIQKKLAYILQLIYEPKICSFGFIKHRNIVDNANKHIKKNEIVNIDLKDFFTQFHFGRVSGMFKAKPYLLGNEAAITLAQITCYRGTLPQGAPTSPIITNMICAPLDNALMSFSKKHNLTYTRYADDLTFSAYTDSIWGNIIDKFNDKFIISSKLQKIFDKHNLVINENKITFRNKFARQEATGLVVNKFPNVKREFYKQIRAILHNCEKFGVYETAKVYVSKGLCHSQFIRNKINEPNSEQLIISWFKSVLVGKIQFIKQVKGQYSPTFCKLAEQLNSIFKENIFNLSYFNKLNEMLQENVLLLTQNTQDDFRQGSAFYVKNVGLFTSCHVTDNNGFFNVYRNPNEKKGLISREINLLSENNEIDYSLFQIKIDNSSNLKLGDSTKIKIGDTVVIAGFPDYIDGDSITIQSCQVVAISSFFGSPLYKVSGRIVHGFSGGVVLNTDNEVVGLIKGGIVSLDEDDSNSNQGFVPIKDIVEDLMAKNVI